MVDLPPEEDEELCLPALKAGLNFIRLATPTTDDKRLPAVLANTSGFVYYVSIAGITGAAAPDAGKVRSAVSRIKRHTKLPVAVGFGVRTAKQVREIAGGAEAVVVGSALVNAVAAKPRQEGQGDRADGEGGDQSGCRTGQRRAQFEAEEVTVTPSCPALCRASTSLCMICGKTWMAGTSPAMTIARPRLVS